LLFILRPEAAHRSPAFGDISFGIFHAMMDALLSPTTFVDAR
jgi:hypothetical protein